MTLTHSLASSVARSTARPLDGVGGGGAVVDRYAQFNGSSDFATPPAVTHTAAAGTLMVRCKLDVATPANVAQTGLIAWNVTAVGATHYPFTSGQAYVSVFRTTRAGPFNLSASITRTNWHWFIVRDDATYGWQCLQANDAGTLYSLSTAAHESWITTLDFPRLGRNSGSNSLDGGIDRMLVGDSRWSDAQIQAVIAGGNGPGDALVRFEFNEISGGKFLDSSGNAKDATITGSPVITDF